MLVDGGGALVGAGLLGGVVRRGRGLPVQAAAAHAVAANPATLNAPRLFMPGM
ncbi:hypothetical protein [Actinokineospora bangkokensis]|uniref:hypothetical protein n=1 Tax=Actinokineospora bangkokensis TaxID=1193682 RepID=UPI001E3DC68B|nr:hypothetical protein [Actinokineospora bangkokensis]